MSGFRDCLNRTRSPASSAMLVSSLYNIVDQIFIGQGVGYLGNAATNVSFPLTTICMAIALFNRNRKRRPAFPWSWERTIRTRRPGMWEMP